MKITNNNNGGLFGGPLNWINARLPYLYKNSIYPSWDIRNSNHGDPNDLNRITPHIITPLKESTKSGQEIDLMDIKKTTYTSFKEANFYFFHYFKFNDSILDLSFELCEPITSNCLGLHFRGHDKIYKNDKENVPIDMSTYLAKVEAFSKINSFDSIFLLSDDVRLKKELSLKIRSKFQIPVFETNLKPVFFASQKNRNDKLLLTRQAVAEMLILSRCSHVLKNHSAFSSWAKIVNPEINMYRISKCKNDWFPDYYLPEF
jgi:hypothetical protein